MHILVLWIFVMMDCSLSIIAVKVSPCARWNRTGITVAGNGTPGNSTNQLNRPNGIYIFKPTNTLYVTDMYNSRIQKISLNQSSMMGVTVASVGQMPYKIYVDDDNGPTIYVALTMPSNRVEKWTHKATSGVQVGNECSFCSGVSVDNEKNVYMTDFGKSSVLRWSPRTNMTTVVATFVGQNETQDNRASSFRGIYVDHINSSLYTADALRHQIQKWPKDANKSIIVAGSLFGSPGNDAASLENPADVWVDDETGTIYVVDTGNRRIQRWLPDASEGQTIIGRSGTNDELKALNDVAFDYEGNIYVSDFDSHRVQMFALIDNRPCFATSANSSETTTPTSRAVSSDRNRSNWTTTIMITLSIIRWILSRF